MNLTSQYAMWMLLIASLAAAATVLLSPRARVVVQRVWARHKAVDSQAGQATSEYVMWAGVLVGVIIAISAVLQAVGVDIIGRLSDVLG